MQTIDSRKLSAKLALDKQTRPLGIGISAKIKKERRLDCLEIAQIAKKRPGAQASVSLRVWRQIQIERLDGPTNRSVPASYRRCVSRMFHSEFDRTSGVQNGSIPMFIPFFQGHHQREVALEQFPGTTAKILRAFQSPHLVVRSLVFTPHPGRDPIRFN